MAKATDISHNPVSWLQQWCTQYPKFTLADGRQSYARVKQTGVDYADAVGRGGITFLQNPETPLNARGRWYESKQLKGGTTGDAYPGESLSDQEWINFAAGDPIYAFEVDEFLEGEWHVRPESSQYSAFKRKRAQMFKDAGRPNNSFLSYGSFWMPQQTEWKVDGSLVDPTSNAFRQYYASPAAARQCAGSYFAFFWNSDPSKVICWPNIKFYPDSPYTSENFRVQKAKCEWLMLGMEGNGKLAYVSWENIESLQDQSVPEGAVHGNCFTGRHVNNPPGKASSNVHPNWDLDQQRAMFFICGLVIATHIAAWDHLGIRGTDPNTIWNATGGDVEVTTWQGENGAPAPYGNPGYTPNRLNWYDYSLCGALWFYKQCERTAGTSWNYSRNRVNNGSWIETQSDKSDNLFNAQYHRPDTMYRVKGNAVDWYWYNPDLGKDQYEVATVDIAGRQFTETVQGGVLHVFNETI